MAIVLIPKYSMSMLNFFVVVCIDKVNFLLLMVSVTAIIDDAEMIDADSQSAYVGDMIN